MTVKLSHIKQALAEIGTLPRESMRHWSASDLAHVTIDNAMPVLLEIVNAALAFVESDDAATGRESRPSRDDGTLILAALHDARLALCVALAKVQL